jgi:RNA polymerase sigma-70 factor (ECF subfamily)
MKPKPSESGEDNSPPRERAEGDSADQGTRDFGTLVETHYVSLYRFGLSLARCKTEAIDLTQHTFYVWAQKGHQLRDPRKAKVWLFSVLRHEFLKRQRHQARFLQSESTLEHACAEEQESASTIDQLDGFAAQQALLSLDDLYREPLTLFYLQEHSYREIAKILEIPIGTVMSRIWRGKMKLRKVLSSRLEKETDGGPVP